MQIRIYFTYINPLFTGKDSNELGIGLECLKIIFVVDFRTIGIQVYVWYIGFSEFVSGFGSDFIQSGGNNTFAIGTCDVFNLFTRGSRKTQ